MAKLTDEQKRQLEELRALEEAPDPEPSNRSQIVNVHVDLSDESAVERGQKLGFLDLFKKDETEDDDADDEPDDEPGQGGFFGGKKR
jgi:hypothetical protein